MKTSSLRNRENIAGILFILPTVVSFLVFFALPLAICIYASFTNWNILSPNRLFVGLRNYERLVGDPKFWISLKNTAYMLIPIPIYLVLALLFAYACHIKIFGEKIFRAIYYLPFISSIVALSLIWRWLFNAQYGLVNNFLAMFGVEPISWLSDPRWTRIMIIIMISWKMIGITSIYYLAALKSIPHTYYEAAQIDGATSFRQFIQITLPLISPTSFYLVVIGLIGSLQTLVEVQMFAPEGGESYGVATIVFYIWEKAFTNSQMGYASAAALVFGLFILLITAIQFHVSKKWVYEGE